MTKGLLLPLVRFCLRFWWVSNSGNGPGSQTRWRFQQRFPSGSSCKGFRLRDCASNNPSFWSKKPERAGNNGGRDYSRELGRRWKTSCGQKSLSNDCWVFRSHEAVMFQAGATLRS